MIGALPAPVQHLVGSILGRMQPGPLYVGTTGNATIERIAWRLGWRHIVGNDVSLWSCALGAHLMGEKLEVRVRAPEWRWVETFMDTSAAQLATLQVVGRLGEFSGANPYHRRMRDAHAANFVGDWAVTHRRIVENTDCRLTGFYRGDVVDFVLGLPDDTTFISYPPTYKGGYEKLYAFLDQVFGWDAPSYPVFDETRLAIMVEALRTRPRWLLGWKDEIPGLRPIAKVKPSNRSLPFWLFGSEEMAYYIGPTTKTAPLNLPRIAPDDEAAPPLVVTEIERAQFAALRSMYLSPSIVPADPMMQYAVTVGGKLIGAVGFTTAMAQAGRVYMMCDFAVSPSAEPRLSKLVLASVLSKEVRHVLEGRFGHRLYGVVTTAFTKRPVSMKYRGLFELEKRGEGFLNYAADMGRWTLEEAWDWWKTNHSKTALTRPRG